MSDGPRDGAKANASRRIFLRRASTLALALTCWPTWRTSAEEPRPAASATPVSGATSGGSDDRATIELLRELLLQRALPLKDPWIEMHLALALGDGISDGPRVLIDDAVAQSIEVVPSGFVQEPRFDLSIERHPFHFLQVMQAVDVPYERPFATPKGTFTRRQIITGQTATFDPEGVQDELSWAVSVLTCENRPDAPPVRMAGGREVAIASLVERHLRETEEAYAGTLAAMQGRAPYGRGPIHTKACNGTHMLYGLIDALRHGYRANDLRARVERLVDATLWRTAAEPMLIDKTLPGDDPLVRLNADAAKLAFLGHALEDFGYAQKHGVLVFTPPRLAVTEKARREVGAIVTRLTSVHDLDLLQSQVPQAYRHMLGDACHALRGLKLWT